MVKYRGWTTSSPDDDGAEPGEGDRKEGSDGPVGKGAPDGTPPVPADEKGKGKGKPNSPEKERINTFEVEATTKFVQVSVGSVDGVLPDARRIRSEERPVLRHYFAVDQEMRRQAGRRRPPNPAPKHGADAPKKRNRSKGSSAGPKHPPTTHGDDCPRCHGEGVYEFGEGYYKACPLCQPTEGDEDLSSLQ